MKTRTQRLGTVRVSAPRFGSLGLTLGLAVALAAACGDSTPATRHSADAVPLAELNLAADPQTVLDSAMALMRRDGTAGMVSVDSDGRPRIRSVGSFLRDSATTPRERFTVFVYTRRSTRKIEQLAREDRVTLYYTDDARISYATLMGRATVHLDPTHPSIRPLLDSATIAFFWPAFPEDFVMLEIRPDWLEFMGPGAWNHPDTWRPQAVVFADTATP